MSFDRIINNKYVFLLSSFINNTGKYGFKNAVKILQRRRKTGYDILKSNFSYIEYCNRIFHLIEKRAGSNINIKNEEDFGYCVIAPVIYDFVKWLYNEANCRELWFLSREGWLLKKAYDIYKSDKTEGAESKYFLASRRAASVAAIKNKSDIKEVLSQYYKGGFKNLVYTRLGYAASDDDFYVNMPEDIERIMPLIDIEDVLKRAEKERTGYLNYINSFNKDSAVVDIGYMGTIQYYLSKLTDRKIGGYYICSHYKNKPFKIGCNIKGLFPVINMGEEQTNAIFKNQVLFESVLKAPYGQFVSYYNEPLYDDKYDYDEYVKSIQKGILDFVLDLTKSDNTIYYKSTFVQELFGILMSKGENIIKNLWVEDSYCSDDELKPL